jgi:hypothetical protein
MEASSSREWMESVAERWKVIWKVIWEERWKVIWEVKKASFRREAEAGRGIRRKRKEAAKQGVEERGEVGKKVEKEKESLESQILILGCLRKAATMSWEVGKDSREEAHH